MGVPTAEERLAAASAGAGAARAAVTLACAVARALRATVNSSPETELDAEREIGTPGETGAGLGKVAQGRCVERVRAGLIGEPCRDLGGEAIAASDPADLADREADIGTNARQNGGAAGCA